MAFGPEDVRKLAQLAHLELPDDRLARGAADLDALLAYIERLQAIDVEGVPETAHHGVERAPLRKDESAPGLPRELLLRGAPSSESGLFEVPRVLSRGPSAAASGRDADEGEVAP